MSIPFEEVDVQVFGENQLAHESREPALIGTIEKRPVVETDSEGNDSIAIRTMSYFSITYDHRLVDGKEAVTFLIRIKDCLESPARLLLEM